MKVRQTNKTLTARRFALMLFRPPGPFKAREKNTGGTKTEVKPLIFLKARSSGDFRSE
jgi:hypothetical protein